MPAITGARRRLTAPRPARVALAAMAACAALPGFAEPITGEKIADVTCDIVQMPTRDGTLLTTYVYKPTGGTGRYPVIMQRNPYGYLSQDGCFTGFSAAMAYWAENGYVGVHQEVRGTFNSEGQFDPNMQEAEDGYDAVEWAASQPWSNGQIGLTGASYLGLTVWQPAIHNPPHLRAIAPSITTADAHDDWLYDNGVFLPWGSQYWVGTTFVPDQIQRQGQAIGLAQKKIDAQIAQWNADFQANVLTQYVWQLPYTEFPGFRQYASYYYDWLWNPNYKGYWARIDTETRWPHVKVPSLNTGAWYDPFQQGTVSNYRGMREQGGTQLAREGTHLVMQAYGHSGDSGTPTFGDDTFDSTYALRFFDYYVKGLNNGFDKLPRVNLYVLVPPNLGDTGGGFWVTADDYPVPGTQFQKWYLGSGGHANTRLGDGTLSTERGGHGVDRFTYDPANPVPTTGGNYLNGGPTLLQAGAAEQSSVELRNDVLVYTSDALASDLPAVGPLKVHFWAISSAPDTDFTAKLVDVRPDGRTENVLDRVVRARFREGDKKAPHYITPGEAYEYTLDVGNIGIIFPAGHKLRLEISSSNFPRVARNLNTAVPNQYDTSKFVVAHQQILHDADHPSFVVMPIAPGIQQPRDKVSGR
jgi:putative CocE/NonD family hydrolase